MKKFEQIRFNMQERYLEKYGKPAEASKLQNIKPACGGNSNQIHLIHKKNKSGYST